MTKKSRQRFKYLEHEKSFYDEIKSKKNTPFLLPYGYYEEKCFIKIMNFIVKYYHQKTELIG